MSDALKLSMLVWNGHIGIAKHDGVSVEFAVWPAAALPGVQVISMKYVPLHHEFEVWEAVKGPRELTREEKCSIYQLLKGIAEGGRAPLLA